MGNIMWLMMVLLFFALCFERAPRVCSATRESRSITDKKTFGERGITGSINQMQNIVEAMMAAGEFGEWGNVMYLMNPDDLPITATFLVPTDDALDAFSLTSNLSAALVLYHTLPRRSSFLDLLRSPLGTRLPTLLPNATILLTAHHASDLSLDHARISHPDIYVDATCAVHGVASVLDFNRYANLTLIPSFKETTPAIEALTPLPSEPSSDAPCLCAEFPLALTALSAAFALRFLRLPLRWR